MNPKLIFSVCRKNLPTILSAGACGGVVLTGWLSYEAGKKEKEEGEEKDWKKWISPALAAFGTICCIAGAHKIHMSREAAMLAAIAFYKAAGEDGKFRVDDISEILADDALHGGKIVKKDVPAEEVKRPDIPNNGTKIKIWEPYTKQWFYASQQDILWAELMANKLLSQRGHCSLNDILKFYSDPNLKKHTRAGARLGWSWDDDVFQEESCYYYAGGWIDMCPQFEERNGEYCFIMEYGIHPDDISEFV
jgi:hypothetical protein